MYKIDLNSDLGEGAAFDAEIIPLVTSANIACGFHAGDSVLMKKTVNLCLESGVAPGAHPGYPDRENFGRTKMNVTPEEVYDFTLYQIGALDAFAKAKGVKLEHIEPHGAMYNMAAKDPALSLAIADAVRDYDSGLILLALSGSEMIKAAKLRGLRYASEVFADRAYEADGTLRARTLEGSMITDENEAISRVIRMIKEGRVRAYTGEDVEIEAHSVCVHGDSAKALDFVKALNRAFAENDIRTVKLSEAIK
ncbi:MAG: LamB/YcsF family protein [Clostridia bacterium]|nr:LamB/YcsF family protein [Clostridia bacterium]